MKKSELKDWMIIETGYDECKMIIYKNTIIDNKINGYTFDDFNDDLINKKFKPSSIYKVYEPVKIKTPFELDIGNIFEEQKPRLLWKRNPIEVSKELLLTMSKEQRKEYIDNLVFPIKFVE